MSNSVISIQNSIKTEPKIEYFVKYKKTGRQVKQVLYKNHLYGKIKGTKWKCVSKKCNSVLNFNESATSLIRDSITHQEGHEISEHEIAFGRQVNLVKFKILNHIKNACSLYQQYEKFLESDGHDIEKYVPFFLLKESLVNELSSKLSPKQETKQESSEKDVVYLHESVSNLELKTKLVKSNKAHEKGEAFPKLDNNCLLNSRCYGCNQFGHKLKSCSKNTELKQVVFKQLKDKKKKNKRTQLHFINNE